MLKITGIHIYPIKATRRVALDEAVVEPRGLAHDRRWMLIDESGTFLTQRDHARLALVRVQVQPPHLVVQAPSMERLTVPFPGAEAVRRSVRIWKDVVAAVEADAAAHAWVSRYLGSACRLICMDEAAARPVDPQYDPDRSEVSFADGYPLLLTTEASLADLNTHLDAPVPMTRFRPNLIVSGGEAFDEDRWRKVRIGSMLFHVVKPCARCVVSTIDQETAEGGKEPLRTLNRFRKNDGKVFFGENLIPAAPGVVRVGDTVDVVAWRDTNPVSGERIAVDGRSPVLMSG